MKGNLMLNGQGIVLALMLLLNAFTILTLISRIVSPNKPEVKSTPGTLLLSMLITMLMAAGACYLAAN
jgi:uncharacterized membrane protein